jgi:PII-like signaling protein
MTEETRFVAARRLRIYIGESDHWNGLPLSAVLLDSLKDQGLAGATVFHGTAGFGCHRRMHAGTNEVLSIGMPVVIEVVDSAGKIDGALDGVRKMVGEGLLTVEDIWMERLTGTTK